MEVLSIIKRIGCTQNFEFFKLSNCDIDMINYVNNIDANRCDICKKNITRSTVFLVKDNGVILQVGKSCLQNINSDLVDILVNAKTQDEVYFDEFLSMRGLRGGFNGKEVLKMLFALYGLRGFFKFTMYEKFTKELYKYKEEIDKVLKDINIDDVIAFLTAKLQKTNNEFLYKLYQYLANIDSIPAKAFTVLQYTYKIYSDIKNNDIKNAESKAQYNQSIYIKSNFIVKDMFLKNNQIRTYGGRWMSYDIESYSYIIITDKMQVIELSSSIALEPTAYINQKCTCNNKYLLNDKNFYNEEKNIKNYISQKYGIVTLCNRLKLI